MFVTVVVAMLDAERYLAPCLEALLAQDYPASNFEVLLVDNGSTDGSNEIARRYQRITLLHEPRRGVYVARNRALAAARGDVCVFTDPDCIADPAWLRHLVNAISEPGVAIVCGRRLAPRRSRWLDLVNDYETTKDEFVLGGNDSETHYGYANNMAVRRELFAQLGVFSELARGGDTLFVRRASLALGPGALRYCREACVTHMEVDGLGVYFRKVFLYARYRRWNNTILRSRPLTMRERLAVFRQTVRGQRHTPGRAVVLLALLFLGALCWSAGDLSARLTADGAS